MAAWFQVGRENLRGKVDLLLDSVACLNSVKILQLFALEVGRPRGGCDQIKKIINLIFKHMTKIRNGTQSVVETSTNECFLPINCLGQTRQSCRGVHVCIAS